MRRVNGVGGRSAGEPAVVASPVPGLALAETTGAGRVAEVAGRAGGQERVLVDAGLLLGRSFRVGWGPGGTLYRPGMI